MNQERTTTARLKHLRMSPRKVRLVANLIKGLNVAEAEKQLKFLSKRAAGPILKLLNSAVANAKHNLGLDKELLFVVNVIVDSGPSLKRQRPRAMGRASQILKRTSHVTIIRGAKGRAVAGQLEPVSEEGEERTEQKPVVQRQETIEKVAEEKRPVIKPVSPKKPYGSTSQSKKRFFSRQSFGNVKKFFRRKSL